MFARLLVLFVSIPLIELFLFLRIGSKIGIGTTVGIVILTGFLGAYLTRREGLKTLEKYQSSLQNGRLPHREILDGLLILIAGAVLLTPGFLTDAAGFALLIPVFRDKVRAFLGSRLKERIHVAGASMGEEERTQTPDTITVEAEVIEDTIPNAPETSRIE